MNVIEFRSDKSSTVLYACGKCRYTSLDGAHAAACCLCPKCGAETKGPGLSWCESCRKEEWAFKDALRQEIERALPIVEDKGEPVMVGDRFYEDAYAAAEAVWDDGDDPTEAIAHPCTVAKAGTPNIAEVVEEAWGSEYDDPDAYDIRLDPAVAEAIQKQIEALAPTVWIPRTKERVALPSIEATV